jgi:hypothetical protein
MSGRGVLAGDSECGVKIGLGYDPPDPVGIIYGILETLRAARMLLCGFDRDVAEKKLDLFELANCLMRSRAQICADHVGRETRETATGNGLFDNGRRVGLLEPLTVFEELEPDY